MKLNEITGKPKAISSFDLLASIKDGVFTKDGRHLSETKDFSVSGKGLKSLVGCPQHILPNFSCENNELTSLEGCPQYIGGHIFCSVNNLTSLKGSPPRAFGDFYCAYNSLTSFNGCPQNIDRDIYAAGNKMTSLKDIHKHIKSINGVIYLDGNPIKSHVLGLLKIRGCKSLVLDNRDVEKIMNKYLPLGDIFDCQEELIEAGLEEFAQL